MEKVVKVNWSELPEELFEEVQNKIQVWCEDNTLQLGFDHEGACVGVIVTVGEELSEVADWNELSRMGLIIALNRTVLHPKGWAIARDPDTGISPCLFFDTVDEKWEYTPEDVAEGIEKLKAYGFQVPGLTC